MDSKVYIFLLVSLSACVTIGKSANILGLFTSESRSHLIVHMSVVRALVEQGHNVTVVTTLPLNDINPGYNHIQVYAPEMPKEFVKELTRSNDQKSGMKALFKFTTMIDIFSNIANKAIQDQKFLKLLQGDTKFDLLLLGYFFNDFQIGVAAHFKCPVVVIWMTQTMSAVNKLVGNPMERSYVPHLFFGEGQPLNFWGRVKNQMAAVMDAIMENVLDRTMSKYYKENFPADKYPSYDEMSKNVSLVLCNHHFSEGPIRPNVPALVEIGGIQIKPKPDPLPEDIKKFLDSSSKHGTIFFSLGSNVQSTDLSPDTIKIIYKVLSGLKQNVLWKWEGKDFPGNSPNILFKQWLPQDDILAHPKIKMFITHGGKGSVVESEYHGVPMVGLPIFGDQLANVKSFENAGYGLSIDYNSMTEESFRTIVLEVLENPKYTENVKKFSTLYRDRPLTAKENAVYWIEYVIRHRGAPHMQSPVVHMNTIQYLGLDVFAFLFVCLYIIVKTVKCCVKFTFRKLRNLVRKTKED